MAPTDTASSRSRADLKRDGLDGLCTAPQPGRPSPQPMPAHQRYKEERGAMRSSGRAGRGLIGSHSAEIGGQPRRGNWSNKATSWAHWEPQRGNNRRGAVLLGRTMCNSSFASSKPVQAPSCQPFRELTVAAGFHKRLIRIVIDKFAAQGRVRGVLVVVASGRFVRQ